MVTVGIWRVYMTAVTLDPAHLPMYMMVGISRESVLAVASHSLDCCHVRLDCHLPPPPQAGLKYVDLAIDVVWHQGSATARCVERSAL
jgi:hypothetical protein